jgi:hypothetical protein
LAEAKSKAEEEEAKARAEREKERRRQEAEEEKLPELQRKFLRRERAREEARREQEEARKRAQAEYEARLQYEAIEGGGGGGSGSAYRKYDDNGELIGGSGEEERGLKRQNSKVKDLMGQYGTGGADYSAISSQIPTIFIISDDDRLKPFGPVIYYNGQDAFEIGAEGSIVAPLDAANIEYGEGQYVFKHRNSFNVYELESAEENTVELVSRLTQMHLNKSASFDNSFSSQQQPGLHQHYEQQSSSQSDSFKEVPVNSQESSQPVASSPRKEKTSSSSSSSVEVPQPPPAPPVERERRRSSSVRSFGGKKSATELINEVAEEGITTVDFSSNVSRHI